MSSPRTRRLEADHAGMTELADRGVVVFQAEGAPPDRYRVTLDVRGLAPTPAGEPALRQIHSFEVYLHLDYPRQAPQVTWLTPIFHPNILPPNRHGGVCIGSWSPSENLADLCERLRRMVGYESFNVEDVLDRSAAAWVREHRLEQGTDLERAVAGA